MLKSIFSFMLIGTLLFSSNPIENIGGNKATADEVSQSVKAVIMSAFRHKLLNRGKPLTM